MSFATVEEIQQHYGEAISRAKDNPAAVIELRTEEKAVLADFRLKLVADRERAVWMREAMYEYPLSKSFPQLLGGQTEEEVKESAKSLHEQLEVAFKEHQRQQEIQRIYEQQLAQSQNPVVEETPSEPAV